MNCDVIRDLLPMYAEGLTSEASNRLIEEHLEECTVCRSIARQMREPIEAEKANIPDPIIALKNQKKKNRRRAVLVCVCSALVVFLGWWIYMETHFTMDTLVTVSTDPDMILSEAPDLALTEDETALYDTIFSLPSVENCLYNEMLTVIPYGEVRDGIGHIIPANAHITEISAGSGNVYIDYTSMGIRIILHYADGNINKAVSRPESDGTVDTLYEVRYSLSDGLAVYQKVVSKHVWFGFSQIPK